jgi:hypothetical protein
MRVIHPDVITALEQPVIRVAFLCLIEFPAPNRLAFTSLLDDYEFNGETFVGLGNLGSISGLDEGSELNPAEYEVTLSGIADEILQAASSMAYLNHPATVWMMLLDENHQTIGEPMIWSKGLTDGAQISYGKSSVVSIQVRNRLVDWQRPRVERYTDGDQQAMHAGDKGLEFVADIASKEVEWPAGSWFQKNK